MQQGKEQGEARGKTEATKHPLSRGNPLQPFRQLQTAREKEGKNHLWFRDKNRKCLSLIFQQFGASRGSAVGVAIAPWTLQRIVAAPGKLKKIPSPIIISMSVKMMMMHSSFPAHTEPYCPCNFLVWEALVKNIFSL